jgi:hypothetical protein
LFLLSERWNSKQKRADHQRNALLHLESAFSSSLESYFSFRAMDRLQTLQGYHPETAVREAA